MNPSSTSSATGADAAVVRAGSHVTLHYRLSLSDGQVVLETFGATPATLDVGAGMFAPALEQCLIGMREGDRQAFVLEPEAAFGPRNPDLVQKVARSLLDQHGVPGEEYAPGDLVEFPMPNGQGGLQNRGVAGTIDTIPGAMPTGRIAGVFKGWGGDNGRGGASWALFDFNHPLAGQALTFEAQIIGVL